MYHNGTMCGCVPLCGAVPLDCCPAVQGTLVTLKAGVVAFTALSVLSTLVAIIVPNVLQAQVDGAL